MAQNILIGVSNIARKVPSAYIGVDGIARKIKAGYVGDVNGIARLFYSQSDLFGDGSDGDLVITSGQTVTLSPVDNNEALPVFKQYSSIDIQAGGTLTVSKCCAGLILKCKGACNIAGTINMNTKACRRLTQAQIEALYDYYPEPTRRTTGGNGSNGVHGPGYYSWAEDRWGEGMYYWGSGEGWYYTVSSISNARRENYSRADLWVPGNCGTGMAGTFFGGGYSGGGSGGAGSSSSSSADYDGGSAGAVPYVGDAAVVSTGGNGGGYSPGAGGTTPGAAGSTGSRSGYNTGGGGGAAGNIGGGTVVIFAKGNLALTGTITCVGGAGNVGGNRQYYERSRSSGSYYYYTPVSGSGLGGLSGGAGGGKIFLMSAGTITNTGTKNVSGGAGATKTFRYTATSQPGTAGNVQVMTYDEYKTYEAS